MCVTLLLCQCVCVCLFLSPISRTLRVSEEVARKASSLQERVTAPTSSEFVARIRALSSDRLTPAMEATSLMSSSSLYGGMAERDRTTWMVRREKRETSQAFLSLICPRSVIKVWLFHAFIHKCVLGNLKLPPASFSLFLWAAVSRDEGPAAGRPPGPTVCFITGTARDNTVKLNTGHSHGFSGQGGVRSSRLDSRN